MGDGIEIEQWSQWSLKETTIALSNGTVADPLRPAFCQSSSTTRPSTQSQLGLVFSVAGPAAWDCLSDELREPLLTVKSFRQLLKTHLFAEY